MSFATKFRNEQNVRFLKAIFFEQTLPENRQNVLYTLKEEDHEGYASFYRLYLEIADITEYNVATTLVDGVEHWEMLCDCDWFKSHLAKMRRALQLKLKSEAVAALRTDAVSGSKTSHSALKFLVQSGYDSAAPERRRAGRPSKEEIARAAQEASVRKEDVNEDFDRVQKVVSLR